MSRKSLFNIPRVILVLIISISISLFISSCSLFTSVAKNGEADPKQKSEKKENAKKKPPIKRNLLE